MHTKLARFAWGVLALNILVILWGAYVRATGSGAGCGAHWPLCNGEVIPQSPTATMLIEFSHRLSSGLALVAVLGLFVWVRRAFGPGSPARRAAAASLVFILTEALLGAGLVLFRLVAQNESLARAMMMPLHLVNTLLLLLCLTLTAHWVSGGAPIRLTNRARALGTGIAMLVLLVGVGKTGAIAALGDTLYPSTSLAEGLNADLSGTSSLLLRLRILHPALAVATAAVILIGLGALTIAPGDSGGRMARQAVYGLVVAQVLFGFANLWLLAPVWMQIVHLLLADLLWIVLVLVIVSALARRTSG
jgi:heme A synthase